MELEVTVKKGVSSCFSQVELAEIARSLTVKIPDNMRLVYYGQVAPQDVTLAWQPTDGIGNPVGKVKTYKDGGWNE